jgi:hypothetical protein
MSEASWWKRTGVEERNRDVGDAEPELREKNQPSTLHPGPCIQGRRSSREVWPTWHPQCRINSRHTACDSKGQHSCDWRAGGLAWLAWVCPFGVCWAIGCILLPVGRRPAGPLHPCGALFLVPGPVGARCQGCSGAISMHDAPEPRGLISRCLGSAKIILLDSLVVCYICIAYVIAEDDRFNRWMSDARGEQQQ